MLKSPQTESSVCPVSCCLADCPVGGNVSEKHLPVARFLWFSKTGFRHEVENSALRIVFQSLIGVGKAAQDALWAVFWCIEIEPVELATRFAVCTNHSHRLR